MESLKQDLVDCIRMLEASDIIDYNGHASIKLDDNRLLINIGSCQRSTLTTADICEIDFGGTWSPVTASRHWSFIYTLEFTRSDQTLRQSFMRTPNGPRS